MEKTNLIEIKKNNTGTGLLIENDGYITNSKDNINLIESVKNDSEWYVPYPFIVDAVFQKCNIKNANGRIYPKEILEREVERYQTKIKEKRALGELNHPLESTIDLGRISHNIIELHWENNTVVGKLALNVSKGFIKHGIISTMGDMAANLILNGYKIGVSSRGVGSVEEKLGQYIVGDDFELICWDIVADPSTPNAWIFNDENEKQYYVESNKSNNKQLLEKITKIKNIIK